MFLEFPSNAILLLGENATLTCIVKATEGAMVQWLLDDQPLPLVEDSTACGGSNNSNSAVAVVSQSPLPGNFAIFHAELTVSPDAQELASYNTSILHAVFSAIADRTKS